MKYAKLMCQKGSRWLATAVALFILLGITGCQDGLSETAVTPISDFTPVAEMEVVPTTTIASLPTVTTPAVTPSVTQTMAVEDLIFLPKVIIGDAPAIVAPSATPTPSVTPTPSLTPSPTATPSPTPVPTIDVAALRSQLAAQGQELAFVKVGFHVTLLPDKTILENWKRRLDEAGIPIFLKSVDNAEPLYNVQNMMRESGVPHILVFRASGGVPNYDLPAVESARQHWEMHKALFPPELDKELVWVETINELDKNRSEWIAEFALETARLAMADGFRWAAFGWAAGEPEPEDWQSPPMLEFLRLAGENPDRLAIALHEGSAVVNNPTFEYPYRTGRFMQLFDIVDRHGIPRPTVLITEWGWKYDEIPASVSEAMEHIAWVSRLYGAFPEVKGAAIWMLGLGCCFADISDQVERLIDPLTQYTLTNYFTAPLPPARASTDPSFYLP